ncbi:CCR4-Not complex component, Not1-domain-containing protein [Spinellus fusiger]|nr:CCR4-Not complex component, Not1-domain-containing protein [Spinellus fusiger]
MSRPTTDGVELSKVIFEQGYSSCSTPEDAMRVMENKQVNAMTVARVLIMMVQTHTLPHSTNDGSTWEVENFVVAAKKKAPDLDWKAVMNELDSPEFIVYDAIGFKLLVNAWYCSQKDTHLPFPVHTFMQPWRNARAQLSVLYQMVYGSPDVLDLTQLPLRKILQTSHIQALPMSMRTTLLHLASQQLNCLDLLEALMEIKDTAITEDLRLLMDRLVLQAPELLLLGLAQIQPIKHEHNRDLLLRLFHLFVIGHANSVLVMVLLWNINPALLLEGFLDMYKKDPTSISRILDLSQEAKILSHILRTDAPFFVLDMAALAARRQHLNMEKWLNERVSAKGIPFVVACIGFLETKCAIEMSRRSGTTHLPTLQLSMEVIKTIFHVLTQRPMPSGESAKIGKLVQICTQLYPQLGDTRLDVEKSTNTEQGDNDRSYSPEVEEMVRIYFERLYTNNISATRFATVLKACQESKEQRQIDFFHCTLHTLLDEARFFNQYPDNELMATGELLGLLIHQHSVSFDLLRSSLKYILDALNDPPHSKMFNFGSHALAQFKDRLPEWPQYTLLLSRIDALRSSSRWTETLTTTLEQLSLHSSGTTEPPHHGIGPREPPGHGKEKGATADVLLDTFSDTAVQAPSIKVQERVSFLINNLSIINMESKKTELAQLLEESTWEWFGHYLVVRRVSIEPNNHELYSSLLKSLDMVTLVDIVVEETYNSIKLLLQSDSITDATADKSILKHLGSWLGRMTLGRNKPIRHKDLSFKDLLLDAYDRDRLTVAIPLTCKVLQHASESKIFKPPNPWIMSILKLLAELYWKDNMKLVLKFEIEIVYKALDVNLNDTEPSSLLKKRLPPGIDIDDENRRLIKQQLEHIESVSNALTEGIPEVDLTLLLAKLQFGPAIAEFMLKQPVAKAAIFRAISEAFEEVVPPVIATSCNIVVASTKELVLKDFATEAEEVKLRKAAHAMVQPLAANLAVATCKDALYKSILSAIQMHLIHIGLPESLAQEISALVAADNIDIVCWFTEHIAQTKVALDIDNVLLAAYTSRITHRERGITGGYHDANYGSSRKINLPESLQPTSNITQKQMQVYDTFHDIFTDHQREALRLSREPAQDGIMEKLEQVWVELNRQIQQSTIPNCAQLPPNHAICLLIRQMPVMMSQSTNPLKTVILFSERVIAMLYQSVTTFALEIYTAFLQSLFDLSGEAAKEALAWLVYADDERKYNAPVIAMLIRYELLPLEEYDVQLAKLITVKADSIIEFSTHLIRLCLLTNTPVTCLEDHILTVAALDKLVKEEEAPESVLLLMKNLKKQFSLPYEEIPLKVDCLELRMLLAQWIRLCHYPMGPQSLYSTLTQKVLKTTQSEEGKYFFFRLCIETCVNYYVTFSPNSVSHQGRVASMIDQFSKLVSSMIAMEGGEDQKAKVKLLSDALSVIILVLANHHERRGTNFDQKPFLRLLSSLFTEVNKLDIHSTDSSMMIAFSDAFYTLQPIQFPGFAFSWLQLISHRNFLPQLMVVNDSKGWTMCQGLVLSLLKFLGPLLEKRSLQNATKTFYRGTLRVLVVLLHDFPEFFCNNYMVFVQAIPHSCIQLRNLVLSAFPRVMHLPDPFTPDLQLESILEYKEEPVLDEGYQVILLENNVKAAIDAYTKSQGQDIQFLDSIMEHINNTTGDTIACQEFLTSFVLYIGSRTTSSSCANAPMKENAAVTVFQFMLSHMEPQGRYLLLNAIADHLRYPNSHTHFFSKALLYLFDKQSETVKEQITRVLLERLIVNRPHPWGLLASFIELIKDPSFWKHEFIRCSPDIERLFDNVSRSIKHTVA